MKKALILLLICSSVVFGFKCEIDASAPFVCAPEPAGSGNNPHVALSKDLVVENEKVTLTVKNYNFVWPEVYRYKGGGVWETAGSLTGTLKGGYIISDASADFDIVKRSDASPARGTFAIYACKHSSIGSFDCHGGKWMLKSVLICSPSAEVCGNNVDEDCNGVAEACADKPDLIVSEAYLVDQESGSKIPMTKLPADDDKLVLVREKKTMLPNIVFKNIGGNIAKCDPKKPDCHTTTIDGSVRIKGEYIPTEGRLITASLAPNRFKEYTSLNKDETKTELVFLGSGTNLVTEPGKIYCVHGKIDTEGDSETAKAVSESNEDNNQETFCVKTAGSVCTPFIESCNGKDDDCDGQVDEELEPISCGFGVCQNSVPRCSNGQLQTCTAKAPQTPVCGDGIDQDCNGADEPCAPITFTIGALSMQCDLKPFETRHVCESTAPVIIPGGRTTYLVARLSPKVSPLSDGVEIILTPQEPLDGNVRNLITQGKIKTSVKCTSDAAKSECRMSIPAAIDGAARREFSTTWKVKVEGLTSAELNS